MITPGVLVLPMSRAQFVVIPLAALLREGKRQKTGYPVKNKICSAAKFEDFVFDISVVCLQLPACRWVRSLPEKFRCYLGVPDTIRSVQEVSFDPRLKIRTQSRNRTMVRGDPQ